MATMVFSTACLAAGPKYGTMTVVSVATSARVASVRARLFLCAVAWCIVVSLGVACLLRERSSLDISACPGRTLGSLAGDLHVLCHVACPATRAMPFRSLLRKLRVVCRFPPEQRHRHTCGAVEKRGS